MSTTGPAADVREAAERLIGRPGNDPAAPLDSLISRIGIDPAALQALIANANTAAANLAKATGDIADITGRVRDLIAASLPHPAQAGQAVAAALAATTAQQGARP